MNDPSKPRLAIDLDDLERQLRRSAEPPAPKKDPLAELARIVGQDDPFRKLLGETDTSASRSEAQPARPQEPAPRPALTAEEEAVLHSRSDFYPGPPPAAYAPRAAEDRYDPPPPPEDDYAIEDEAPAPRRSRRVLFAVGAVLGITLLGAGATC